MSQKSTILHHLLTYGRATKAEMWERYNIWNSGARVEEIRKDYAREKGYNPIKTKMVPNHGAGRHGVWVWRER